MLSRLGDLKDQLGELEDVITQLSLASEEDEDRLYELEGELASLQAEQEDRNQALKGAWAELSKARLLGQDYREVEAWNQLDRLINQKEN